jgi:hypothetical protein
MGKLQIVGRMKDGVSLQLRSNHFSRTLTRPMLVLPPPLHIHLHTTGGVLFPIRPLFAMTFAVFRVSSHPRLRRFFALTGLRAARGLSAMLAQKTSSSLTRQTGSHTDGLASVSSEPSLARSSFKSSALSCRSAFWVAFGRFLWALFGSACNQRGGSSLWGEGVAILLSFIQLMP